MSEQKALFFDIDGTIWNEKNVIPDSCREAFRQLHKRGHLTFICSGRARGYIQNEDLLSLGFDGIISGCGTMVEYRGETILYRKLDTALVEKTINTVRSYGFRPILEGKDFLYLDDEDFGSDRYGIKLKHELGSRRRTIAGEWGKWECQKLSCATENADTRGCYEALSSDYDYIIHDAPVVEMVPKGFHKGMGIHHICRHLGLDIRDTFAFGDSANDLEMLETAGTGVAMGNGQAKAKEKADYVTRSMMDDGIYHACAHFGLIGY